MYDIDAIFEAPRKRPSGITLIAILLCIQGAFRLLAAIFFILGSFLAGWTLSTHSVVAGVISGVLIAILGLVELFFAWGLWTLKRWAYWGTLILMALDILGSVFEFELPLTGIGEIFGGVIIPVVVLIYFLAAPNVRKAFLA